MNSQDFRTWLVAQKDVLDLAIEKAARRYWQHRRTDANFGFDLNECQFESFNLIREKDLCYDRPNTAFAYSIWYHARRVNTFLSHFARRMEETSAKVVNVFDLGAGTGAVQWSVGLFIAYLTSQGKRGPHFRIINVDISPFMLEYNRDYLWPSFLESYPVNSSLIAEYMCNSWMNSSEQLQGENWLSASYLFDISDADSDAESNYSTAAQKGFRDLASAINPSKALLLTSGQERKKQLLTSLVAQLKTEGYDALPLDSAPLWLNGRLNRTSELRGELARAYANDLTGNEGFSLRNATSWTDGSFTSCSITRRQQTLLDSRISVNKLDVALFNPPIKVRRDVVLNPEQKRAAQHVERHTIITGPASAGQIDHPSPV